MTPAQLVTGLIGVTDEPGLSFRFLPGFREGGAGGRSPALAAGGPGLGRAVDEAAAPVEGEGAAGLEAPAQLVAGPLDAGLGAGEADAEPVGESLLGEALEFGEHEGLAGGPGPGPGPEPAGRRPGGRVVGWSPFTYAESISIRFQKGIFAIAIAAASWAMTEYDTLIIGGGPAGASAAAILAEYGHRVVIAERERFPRYHIGESLIPFTFQPLERLGLIPRMRESHFVKKYSVTFVTQDGRQSEPFYFHTRYDRDTVAQTWQVLRSEFDLMLLNNARDRGAEVREETRVDRLIHEGGRVAGAVVTDRTGATTEVRARLTIDCTGKEAFTSNAAGWRMKDPYLNKIAVWTYYRGSKREPGMDEGATTVAFVPEKGWFWHIPQHEDMVSVGVVAEGKYLTRDGVREPKEIFGREVRQNRWIEEHLAAGEQMGGYFVTSEYSRHSRHCSAPGLLLAGDAFAFLDPVFSSGVMLALKSGVMAGEEVHRGLLDGDLSPTRFAAYGRTMREGVENMRRLVYAFYDPRFSFRRVIGKYPDAVGTITDCLSGDVNKDFSELWRQIGEFVPLPDGLPYGLPLETWAA